MKASLEIYDQSIRVSMLQIFALLHGVHKVNKGSYARTKTMCHRQLNASVFNIPWVYVWLWLSRWWFAVNRTNRIWINTSAESPVWYALCGDVIDNNWRNCIGHSKGQHAGIRYYDKSKRKCTKYVTEFEVCLPKVCTDDSFKAYGEH